MTPSPKSDVHPLALKFLAELPELLARDKLALVLERCAQGASFVSSFKQRNYGYLRPWLCTANNALLCSSILLSG